MTKIIAVASGKGGVGKTTTAINLGTALAFFKRSAIVVDGDLKTPCIGVYLGSPMAPSSVHDAVNSKKSIKKCVYLHPSGTWIAPGSISLADLKNTDSANLGNVLKELEGTSEIVIVDAAAGLGEDMFSAVDVADEVIIVSTPDLPSVTNALKAKQLIEDKGITVIGTVLNKVRGDELELSPEEIEAILEMPVIALVPHDESIRESLKKNHPVVYSHPDAPSSVAYKELAALLIGQKYEVLTKR